MRLALRLLSRCHRFVGQGRPALQPHARLAEAASCVRAAALLSAGPTIHSSSLVVPYTLTPP